MATAPSNQVLTPGRDHPKHDQALRAGVAKEAGVEELEVTPGQHQSPEDPELGIKEAVEELTDFPDLGAAISGSTPEDNKPKVGWGSQFKHILKNRLSKAKKHK